MLLIIAAVFVAGFVIGEGVGEESYYRTVLAALRPSP
jgi:hypothetical protein